MNAEPNKNKWKLRPVVIAGKELWQVYRLIDVNLPETRTNVETIGGYYENKWCAERLADACNKEGRS